MSQTFKISLFYSTTFFFNNANIAIPTTEPITTAAKNPNGFPITGNTNIPPWGALNWQLNNKMLPFMMIKNIIVLVSLELVLRY